MSDNPYHRRKATHVIGRGGRASEKTLTKKLGGRAMPASGAMAGAKGDIDLGYALMEAKSTQAESYRLEHSTLAKITHEARAKGKRPLLAVTFTNPQGQPLRNGEWVMMPLADWTLLNKMTEPDTDAAP